jgi:hypothetical protein
LKDLVVLAKEINIFFNKGNVKKNIKDVIEGYYYMEKCFFTYVSSLFLRELEATTLWFPLEVSISVWCKELRNGFSQATACIHDEVFPDLDTGRQRRFVHRYASGK